MKIILLIMIGLSLVHAEFLRENTKNVVLDTTTNLMWQDDETLGKNWATAITYCENLTLATFTDWRLPNKNELKSIVDTSMFDPAISSVFQEIDKSESPFLEYWSSTTYAKDTDKAWYVDFNGGSDNFLDKVAQNKVRCVRDY